MSFELWKILYWMLGAIGISGTIALFAFYPAIAITVVRAVVRFFSFVLSYRAGCALLAAIFAAIAADYWRHSHEDAKHAAEVEAFNNEQDERDRRIREETAAEVLKKIEEARAANAQTDKEVKDFTDALPKPPETGNPFRVGDDSCRLRQIYGQVGCGPDGTKGVPQADTKNASVRDRAGHGLSGIVGRIRRDDKQGQ